MGQFQSFWDFGYIDDLYLNSNAFYYKKQQGVEITIIQRKEAYYYGYYRKITTDRRKLSKNI